MASDVDIRRLEETLRQQFGIEPPWVTAYREAMREALKHPQVES